MVKECRDFFKFEVRIKTPSVNLNNVEVIFNSLTLYSEDEEDTVVIKNRRVVFEKEKSSEGFKVMVFVLNEGDKLEERIDCLLDEEYEITDVDLIIKDNNKIYDYNLNEYSYIQVEGKEVEIQVDEEMKNALELLSKYSLDEFGLNQDRLSNNFFELLKDEKEFVETLNLISKIDL